MKKNKIRGILTIFLFFTLYIWCHGQDLDIEVHPFENRVLVSLKLNDYDRVKVIENLDRGLRIEVEYQIRLYKQTGGFFRIFGDFLQGESHPVFEASKDLFSKKYQFSDAEGYEFHYQNPDDFLDHFFSLNQEEISIPGNLKGEIYILCRARIKMIKLIPPLNILSFFVPNLFIDTPWKKSESIGYGLPHD